MTKIAQKLDFKGYTIYVGIDVHLKSWNISIYCGNQFLKSFNQPPTIEALSHYLFTNYTKVNK